MIERSIKRGTKFIANSKGLKAVWIVTRRIKTEEKNAIYTRVLFGKDQTRKYTGPQFGHLLREGIVELVAA